MRVSKNGAVMAADRFFIRHPREWYMDLLTIEAWIKGRSLSDEACNLLCARLMQREQYRNQALEHMARKRGITSSQMIEEILRGTAEQLTSEEYRQMAVTDPDEESQES